jgi:D-ribose pyranose/furanose isomerase RbsD
MATDRKLIDYLPQFLQVFREIATIMEVEQFEIDHLNNEIEDALSDQFILHLTEKGAKRWETMLGISPKDTDTLEERRFRILTKQSIDTPYTLRKLEQVLTTLCGADGYLVKVGANEHHVEVKLAVGKHNNYSEVETILNKMIPANLTSHIELMYNPHRILSQFTHAQLSAYTHDQLRNEVLN